MVRSGLLLAGMAFVSGTVDAYSFAYLDRVFTANMTGNLVLLALAAGGGQADDAARSTLALAGFAVGALVGFRSAGPAPGWGVRTKLALGCELVVLLGFAIAWDLRSPAPLLVVLAAIAMGLQSAVATRISISGLSTTYVTSTITALTGQLADLSRPDAGMARRIGVLIALGLGAGASVPLATWQHGLAPWLPVVVLAAVLIGTARVRA